MGGVPSIRGLDIPVATVLGMIADGMTEREILSAYPDLDAEDIHEVQRYAAEAVRERELPVSTAFTGFAPLRVDDDITPVRARSICSTLQSDVGITPLPRTPAQPRRPPCAESTRAAPRPEPPRSAVASAVAGYVCPSRAGRWRCGT
jgi:uncharacterized protein (DUF433 family)